MKILLEFASEPIISALGWTLVHSVWQGTVLTIFAASFFYFARKKSASLRYNAGITILGLQIFSTIATLSFYISKIPAASISDGYTLKMNTATANLDWQNIEYNLSLTTKVQLWLQMHISELVICWLIGTALLMLRFVGGWIQTEILRSKAKIVMDQEWRTRFGLLSARLNISQEIEFRETNRILTPMVIGAFKPMVLIPVGLLTGFSVSQVEAILAHELAHVRRNDYLINLLQSIVEVIYFFHPGLWWLSEKVRTERENCCDDIAVNVCGDRISLAHALVKVAEWESAPSLAMAFASKKPLLLQRVRRVMGLAPKPARTFTTLPVMLIAISLVVGISVYAVGQNEKKTDKKSVKTSKTTSVKNNNGINVSIADTIIVPPSEPKEVEVSHEKSMEEIVNLKVDSDIHVSSDNISFKSDYGEISTDIKGNLIGIRMGNRVSSDDSEKIRMQIEELQLQMEKYRFDAERAGRVLEKLEWKKQAAMDSRDKLMEKRGAALNSSKSNDSKSEDIEKQLGDFEDQIKIQEEIITKLNTDLIESRKEVFKAEEPMRKIGEEIETLSGKIDRSFEAAMVHGEVMKIAGYPKFGPAPPKPPRAPKPLKAKVATVPANPSKPAKAPTAPPAPPAPPRKK